MNILNPSMKRPTAKYLIPCALAVMLTCGAAAAQDNSRLLKFDTNGDQQLSKGEYLSGAAARFDAADLNRDNFLSNEERRAQRQNRRAAQQDRRFAKTDLNNDGVISKDEFDSVRNTRSEKRQARRAAVKARIDSNGDGQIDAQERAAFKDKRQARKAARKDRRKDRRKAFKGQKKQAADSNQDGLISRDEHMAVADRMFTFLDANADGVLNQGEGQKRRQFRQKKKNRP